MRCRWEQEQVSRIYRLQVVNNRRVPNNAVVGPTQSGSACAETPRGRLQAVVSGTRYKNEFKRSVAALVSGHRYYGTEARKKDIAGRSSIRVNTKV